MRLPAQRYTVGTRENPLTLLKMRVRAKEKTFFLEFYRENYFFLRINLLIVTSEIIFNVCLQFWNYSQWWKTGKKCTGLILVPFGSLDMPQNIKSKWPIEELKIEKIHENGPEIKKKKITMFFLTVLCTD